MDIVLLTLPYTDSKIAPAAPAVLKTILDNHGYSSDFIDFNIEILHSEDNVKIAFKNFALLTLAGYFTKCLKNQPCEVIK